MQADGSELRDSYRGEHSGRFSYFHRIRRDRSVARAIIHTLSNLTGAPLSLWARRTPREIFSVVKQASNSAPFSRMTEFHQFVALANAQPEEFLSRVTKQPRAWRPLFESLEQEILLARSRRSEPLVRLLRDHWAWRWMEIASIYDCILKGAVTNPLAWQTQYSDGLLITSIVPIELSDLMVLVGPFRDNERAGLDQYSRLSNMVDRFYAEISETTTPLYSLDRLSQFYFSRPTLTYDNITRILDIIQYTFSFLGTYRKSKIDLADLQSAVVFGFALAELHDHPTLLRVNARPISIYVNYSLLRPGEGPSDRKLAFRGVLHPLSGFTECDAGCAESGAIHPQVRVGDAQPGASDEAAILVRALWRRLSKSAIAIHGASAQQGLEELLLLRYKLSDNFGVLTAYGTAAPQSPLQGTGDEDADRTADKELGRRIAREVAEVTGANIGVIYRYNYLEQHLEVVGLHTDGRSSPRVQLSDYEWMVAAGHNQTMREASVAYNAADRNRPASFASRIPSGGLVHEMLTQAPPPRNSVVPLGGAVVAVPIRVFGRVWGVVEVVSIHGGWFDTRALEILQRVADLIGPYYHEHLLMKMLYNIADIPPGSEPGGAFVTLAKELREMTLSDGACVWLSDSINSDEFSLSGCSGREDLEEPGKEDAPKIAKAAKNSVALNMIVKHKTWFAGVIGEHPLDGDWLLKPHTRSLQGAGFKYLALLPVYGEDFSRKAVISLYSRKSPFSESWQSWGAFIANYIGVVLSRVYSVEEKERSGRRLIAHEVVNAVRIARGSSGKVFDWSKALPKKDVHSELHNWKSDISTYLDLVENLITGWADAEAENVPAGMVLVTALRATVAGRPEVTVSIREEFNASLQPLSADMRRKQLSNNIIIDEHDVSIRIHREALRMILSNLSANAVKYSNLGAPIQLRVIPVKFGLRMSLRNLGVELAPGEEDRIFDMEFRGARTQDGVPGKGLGLYIAKQICDAYGITLGYEAQPAPQPGEVWHQFSLEFPKSRIEFWGAA